MKNIYISYKKATYTLGVLLVFCFIYIFIHRNDVPPENRFLGGERFRKEVAMDHSKMGHGSASMEAEMAAMISFLEGKTGDALDKAFLDEMIIHHEGAVEMAQSVLRSSQRPELRAFAQEIISAQSQEIEKMKKWNTEWFGQ
jgi:uncharacterized protein (DUF305 family)